MRPGPINILFSLDRHYWQQFATALASLLLYNQDHALRIFAFIDRHDETSEGKVLGMLRDYPNAALEFHVLDETPFRHFRIDGHISLASYFRLFLTELLEPEIDKLIYLDSDLIVCANLGALWNTSIEEHYLAAVPDPFNADRIIYETESREPVFNAGVLLINVAKWRADNVLPRFVGFIERNAAGLRFHDQDTLNAVFAGRIKPLPYKWNFQARMGNLPPGRLSMTWTEYEALRQHPAIIHYTTVDKPWHYKNSTNYEQRYHQMRALTPWRNETQPDRTLKNVLLKHVKLRSFRRALRWRFPAIYWQLQGQRKLDADAQTRRFDITAPAEQS